MKAVRVLTLVSLVVLGAGCGGSVSNRLAVTPDIPAGISECWGAFQIVFDPSEQTLVLERDAQIDVTKWAQIGIDSLTWDEVSRNWTIEAWIRNPTKLTGYGVWVVFTELGEKKLIGQDGFVWISAGPDLKRVPFLAVSKDHPLREFPPQHVEYLTIVIHWPEGVNKWAPIKFFIDASYPAERVTPMVENLSSGHIGTDEPLYWVKAWVADFQDPGTDLEVYADLTAAGGGSHTPMYDDGLHEDGDAGDSIFGATFNSTVAPGLYTVTVHALDPAQNAMENDVDVEIVEPGQPETITVLVPNGGEVWQAGSEQVISWESTHYSGTVKIEYSKDDFVSDVHVVAASELNDGAFNWVSVPDDPSENVKVRITLNEDPSVTDTSDGPFTIKSEEDPCRDFEQIRKGMKCNIDWECERLVKSQEEYEALLKEMGVAPLPPQIDWEHEMVAGFYLGEMMHGGFEIEMNSACVDDAGVMHVDYTKWWPGQGCSFPWVICQPYMMAKIERYDGPVVFEGEWQEKICK